MLPEDPGDRQPLLVITSRRVHVQGSFWTWLAYLWPFALLFFGAALCGHLH